MIKYTQNKKEPLVNKVQIKNLINSNYNNIHLIITL